MNLNFFKYQGTGNDFVMIDDRQENLDLADLALIGKICDRKFGIGADGLILIRNHPEYDFEMIYFNADGSQSMCGNGARCAVAFAHFLGLITEKTKFLAIDGPHEALYDEAQVELKMGNVKGIEASENDSFVNTGSPHHVQMVDDVHQYAVVEMGKKIRFQERYAPEGTNVNFVESLGENEVFVRTYERGVENETLSCGTGVTAVALAYGKNKGKQSIKIQTRGGELSVRFTEQEGSFSDIWLIGPAKQVFAGQYQINEQKLEA